MVLRLLIKLAPLRILLGKAVNHTDGDIFKSERIWLLIIMSWQRLQTEAVPVKHRCTVTLCLGVLRTCRTGGGVRQDRCKKEKGF